MWGAVSKMRIGGFCGPGDFLKIKGDFSRLMRILTTNLFLDLGLFPKDLGVLLSI